MRNPGLVILGMGFFSLLGFAIHSHPEGHKLLSDPAIIGVISALLLGGGFAAVKGGK